ncbi:hypothetical protein R1flu_019582 [Riccia fluitans]|uniref:Uncharacterized protein n=1 Tax=Riccia fluitans TaxID=41844 RepID=A0ABD1ZMW6_9MARC
MSWPPSLAFDVLFVTRGRSPSDLLVSALDVPLSLGPTYFHEVSVHVLVSPLTDLGPDSLPETPCSSQPAAFYWAISLSLIFSAVAMFASVEFPCHSHAFTGYACPTCLFHTCAGRFYLADVRFIFFLWRPWLRMVGIHHCFVRSSLRQSPVEIHLADCLYARSDGLDASSSFCQRMYCHVCNPCASVRSCLHAPIRSISSIPPRVLRCQPPCFLLDVVPGLDTASSSTATMSATTVFP